MVITTKVLTILSLNLFLMDEKQVFETFDLNQTGVLSSLNDLEKCGKTLYYAKRAHTHFRPGAGSQNMRVHDDVKIMYT